MFRAAAIVLLEIFVLILQTKIFSSWPVDPLVILVVLVALEWGTGWGVANGFLAGVFLDSASVDLLLYSISLPAVGAAVGQFGNVFTRASILPMVFIMTLAAEFLNLIVIGIAGRDVTLGWSRILLVPFFNVLLLAILIWVWQFFSKFKRTR